MKWVTGLLNSFAHFCHLTSFLFDIIIRHWANVTLFLLLQIRQASESRLLLQQDSAQAEARHQQHDAEVAVHAPRQHAESLHGRCRHALLRELLARRDPPSTPRQRQRPHRELPSFQYTLHIYSISSVFNPPLELKTCVFWLILAHETWKNVNFLRSSWQSSISCTIV